MKRHELVLPADSGIFHGGEGDSSQERGDKVDKVGVERNDKAK